MTDRPTERANDPTPGEPPVGPAQLGFQPHEGVRPANRPITGKVAALPARSSTSVKRGPTVWTPFFAVGLIGIGVLLGMLASLAMGAMGVAALMAQVEAPQSTVVVDAAPTQTPRPGNTPVPTPGEPTPVPPEPTPAVSNLGRDVRLGISEPYLSAATATGLRNSEVGGAIEDSSMDVQPGNIIVIRARPKGSRDFALTFTGQLRLAGDSVSVAPLSSSALLTPFRGRIAREIEASINARIAAYRSTTNFRILGLTTSNDEVLVDLALR